MHTKHRYIGYRPTWAEINLKNLIFNFRKVKGLLARSTKIMVTVKADAYGHGLIPISKKLQGEKVDYLGVASIDEGIQLRKAGIRVPILVLGIVLKEDVAPLFAYNLATTVCTEGLARALNEKARALKKKINVHIKVDTGMGRLGILVNQAPEFVKMINRRFAHLRIEGLFTHFPSADTDKKFTQKQIVSFGRLVKELKNAGITIPLVHAANSMGVLGYRNSHFTMVRPGLIIYGLYPKEKIGISVKPVLSLKTKVVYTKKVPCGYGISYGRAYVTHAAATIATLPIGYGDGYPRNLSNKAEVLLCGKKFRISGRICMDQIMVDVGNAVVEPRDEAVLIGTQGKHQITAEQLASLSGTIPYEIVCGLGSRIPRVYIE
ncbi:MAG: alanine racemase [Candidatus Omnitrophota bacterium]|jgi:alanine racemase|nr:MAG: alanine racemase [Candidatus Omnitrophota bacterium]